MRTYKSLATFFHEIKAPDSHRIHGRRAQALPNTEPSGSKGRPQIRRILGLRGHRPQRVRLHDVKLDGGVLVDRRPENLTVHENFVPRRELFVARAAVGLVLDDDLRVPSDHHLHVEPVPRLGVLTLVRFRNAPPADLQCSEKLSVKPALRDTRNQKCIPVNVGGALLSHRARDGRQNVASHLAVRCRLQESDHLHDLVVLRDAEFGHVLRADLAS